MKEALPIHRIALESRSGIWLLFVETLNTSVPYSRQYKQELIRIFTDFFSADNAALQVMRDKEITTPLIIRGDKLKNEMLRPE